jgi:hypothetical protein
MSMVHMQDWGGLERVAQALAKSDMVPQAYKGRPENILLAAIAGQDFGWSPAMALRSFNVIQGTPSLKPEVMLALVRRAGHSVSGEVTDDAATIRGKRCDSGDTMTVTYGMDDARRAGLLGKQNWKNHPKDMMWARAVSALCRRLFADVTLGAAYTADELGAETDADNNPISIQVTHTPVDPETERQETETRFFAACEREGIDPADVLRMAQVTQVTVENLPTLRAAFNGIRKAIDAHPAELVAVVNRPEEAQVINIDAAIPSKKASTPRRKPASSGGHLTEQQRKLLMVLAGQLGWSREDRMALSQEMLAVELESWNDLSEFQAAQLIAHMEALLEDRRQVDGEIVVEDGV